MEDKKKIVVICGPTASGKTGLAIDLCEKFNGEVISADSMQVYKNLDMLYVDTLDADKVIGTGINAMLRSLDRYTEYYPADVTKGLKY